MTCKSVNINDVKAEAVLTVQQMEKATLGQCRAHKGDVPSAGQGILADIHVAGLLANASPHLG